MARRNHEEHDELEENHEINVTPFIDVMLVLLIIFMVAAPLATVSLPVELPVSSQQALPDPDTPLQITLAADHTLSLNDASIARDQLAQQLDVLSGGNREQRVFVRADQRVAYGELMQLMDQLRQAGYLKVALVAQEQGRE